MRTILMDQPMTLLDLPTGSTATVAELAARADGTDWPGVVSRAFGLWAAGHFDRAQSHRL